MKIALYLFTLTNILVAAINSAPKIEVIMHLSHPMATELKGYVNRYCQPVCAEDKDLHILKLTGSWEKMKAVVKLLNEFDDEITQDVKRKGSCVIVKERKELQDWLGKQETKKITAKL